MLNPRVCICDYCGRWFMPKGKHDAKYCSNIPGGKTSTCQTLGAQRDFVQKTRSESVYKAYRMMYKRLNQRLHKGAMTRNAFKEWQGNAQLQLELCRLGEITLETFKSLIGMK